MIARTIALGALVASAALAQEPPPWREGEPVLCDWATHAPPLRPPGRWSTIVAALEQRDFERLEALLAALRKSPPDQWAPSTSPWSDDLDDLGQPAWLEHIDAWCAAKPGSSTALTVRGRARISWAWKARGGGWAHTVTDEGWRVFGERLGLARADLERAAELDPENDAAPTFLITVAMGLGLDRAEAQRYLDRAVATAHPHATDHHERFVTYLLPKWHGQEGDALQYARQVADAKGADPVLHVVVIKAHKKLCEHLEPQEQRRYFEQVRDEMRRRYDAILAAYPDAVGIWRGRAEFFETLGDMKEAERARARCVELDDVASMVLRARCYERGSMGLTRDPVRAARLYCRAAWRGSEEAKAELAQILLEGRAGVPVDAERGLTLLREALEKNDLQARFYMGRALHDGAFGLAKDQARGRALVEQSAREGHIQAAGLLGRWLYLEGRLREGLQQLNQAATNDDGPSMLVLGQIVGLGQALGGPTIRPDPRRGAIYLRWAVEKGEAGAREALVELLRRHPAERRPGDP